MASVFGRVFNGLLCQRNILYKQALNNIRKYVAVEQCELVRDEPSEVIETLDPLLNASNLTKDICSRVRNDMITKHLVPENTVDIRILDICVKTNKYDIAAAYINCFERTDKPLNIIVLSKYLTLYLSRTPNSIFEEHLIINICNRVNQELGHIPNLILFNCIIALCKTHKWKDALQIIKKNELSDLHRSNILMCVITAAYRNKCADIGQNLLSNLSSVDDIHCNDSFYDAYLNYYLQEEPAKLVEAMKKQFILWSKNDIVPVKKIIDIFENACNQAGFKMNYVTINRKGTCPHCNNKLYCKPMDKEFQKLARNIIPKLIVGGDIFQSTTPWELGHFQTFVSKTGPFDIVIDALNICNGSNMTKRLMELIQIFAKVNKNILVITRRHMSLVKKWDFPLNNVHFFFLSNTTKDDPYILYATLTSGVNAKFVTTDLLRQHFHKLFDEKLRKVFRRWQFTHQYHCTVKRSEKFELIEPLVYDPYTQCNNGYWHIPYREDSQRKKLLYKPVDTWVCVKLSKKKDFS